MPEGIFVSNDEQNPYKGLKSFTYNDRHNYYGRSEESKSIAESLHSNRLFTLLGASGSGKSSLIFAGLVPLIEGDGVEIVDFRPLQDPFHSLAFAFIPTLYPDKIEQMKKSNELKEELLSGDIHITQLVEMFQKETQSTKHP